MKELVDKLLDELMVNELTDEFRRQAGLMARRAFQHARAEDQVRKYDELLELSFSQHYAAYRANDDKAKENDCKAHIREQDDYQAAQAKLRRAQYNASILKAAVKAFDVKGQMLMQLGADRRMEYSNVDLKLSNVSVADKKKKAEKIIRESLKNTALKKKRRR